MRKIIGTICLFVSIPLLASEGEHSTSAMVEILKFLNLVGFFGLMAYFLYRPLQTFFHDQKNEVKTLLKSAEENVEKAQKLRLEIEEKEAHFKKEEESLKARTEKEMEELKARMEEEIQQEVERLKKQFSYGMQMEKKKMEEEVRSYALRLAAKAAEELVETHVNPEDRQRFVARIMERLQG